MVNIKTNTIFTIIISIVAVVLLATTSFAVISDEYQSTHCKDKIMEGYELCEPNTDFNLCPEIGKKINNIVMGCHLLTCDCVPDRTDCGNGVHEGTEMCEPSDPAAVDNCPWLGEKIGHPLKCDPDTCECIPDGAAVVTSHCGDDVKEGNEECEKNSQCTSAEKCENCTCVRLVPEEPVGEPETVENATAPDLPSVEEIVGSEENETLIAGLNPSDFLGKQLEGFAAKKFSDRIINLKVIQADNTTTIVGITTKYGVVQEITSTGYESPAINMETTQAALDKINSAENTTQAIDLAFDQKEITYKPTGFFASILCWIAGLFG